MYNMTLQKTSESWHNELMPLSHAYCINGNITLNLLELFPRKMEFLKCGFLNAGRYKYTDQINKEVEIPINKIIDQDHC